jgi:putative hydrolase of the HAD superfamily
LSAAVNWDAVGTVLLDMDGTLLDLHYDNHFWQVHVPLRYAEIHALPYTEALAKLGALYDNHRGTLAWYCLDFWGEQLQLDIVELKKEVQHLIAVRPDVPDFLAALRASGRRVALVTNAHPASLDLKMRETGLAEWFDALISSHSLGLPKEVPEFWDRLAGVEPFDPARTLFVDDSLPVLASARAHGIAQLLAVCNPDSRQPHKDCGDYPAIASFAEVMPPR